MKSYETNEDLVLQEYMRKGAEAFLQRDFVSAIFHLENFVEIDITNARVWNDLGQCYMACGDITNATRCFKTAANLDQALAEPLLNLGIISKRTGNFDDAKRYYLSALGRRSIYPEACYNIALINEAMENFTSAIRWYRKALSQRPNYLQALNNLGVLLTTMERYEEAERILDSAVKIHPKSPEILNSLGTCLKYMGDITKAFEFYRKARDLGPDLYETHWNLAQVELAVGQFKEGWSNYRYRPNVDRKQFPMPHNKLQVNLENIDFQIHGEQGLGDELFFSRFIGILRDRGATIEWNLDERITAICERGIKKSLKVSRVTPAFKCLIGDLPFLLNIKKPLPSLRIGAHDKNIERMKDKLSAVGHAPYIGFTYRAGQKKDGLLYKEIDFKSLLQCLMPIDATYINLQRHINLEEQTYLDREFNGRVFNFSSCNNDLEEILAVMELLDEYVGVSNTNMHLRAASGKFAKVLVTNPPEYRWMDSGEESPWFPGFKIYRQSKNMSWKNALNRLRRDLLQTYGQDSEINCQP